MSESLIAAVSSPSEFKRQLIEAASRERAREREVAYSSIPDTTRIWLALTPMWTLSLADACELPMGEGDRATVFGRLVEAGILEIIHRAIPNRDPAREAAYTMNAYERVALLDDVLSRDGPQWVCDRLVEIGEKITTLGPQLPNVPPTIIFWAELAKESRTINDVVAAFDEKAKSIFERRTTSDASAELAAWIDVARPLASLLVRTHLSNAFDLAVERASRMLELMHQLDNDRQYLESFLERTESINAAKRLIEGDDNTSWALHLIGVGGVGKTMLLRYISAKFAEQQQIATARIDFDYLNPDYPRLNPGQLLWSFAQELRLYDRSVGNGAVRRFEKAMRLLVDLQARLQANRPTGDKSRSTDDPIFREALNFFIEGLQFLGSRVVLIVDTCEELAKIVLDPIATANVEETFRILRALHDGPASLDDPQAPPSGGMSGLRVIFAGRLPLGSSGDGWDCSAARALPARPYLRLHEVRGFTPDEAKEFLAKRMHVPDILIDPIKERSPDIGRVAAINWHNDEDRPIEMQRYNPYELRIYSEWALEEPAPTPEEIRTSDHDRYVELRILQRLNPTDFELAFPAIALVGSFDYATLRAMVDGPSKDLETFFDMLKRQEWTTQHYEPMAGGDRLVIDIQPPIRTRLLHYFKDSVKLLDAQKRAADRLEYVTLQEDLANLNWTTFDAALRVLDLDLDSTRVTRWWEQVEQRILRERDYEWVFDLTRFLTSEGAAAGPPEVDASGPTSVPNRARSAVLLTYASAGLHTGKANQGDIERIWMAADQAATQTSAASTAADAVPHTPSVSDAVLSLRLPDVNAAVDELLKGSDDIWALHIVGRLGLGKSAVLRYITDDLAPQIGIITVLVNFDYFNLDHPQRVPTLLLAAIARELRTNVQDSRKLRRFDQGRQLLAAIVASQSHHNYRSIDDPLFLQALELVVEGLDSLDRPVILIIDSIDGVWSGGKERWEAVEEVLDFLSMLHNGSSATPDAEAPPIKGVPGLRVILAGRQTLASRGYDWDWKGAERLPERPYLRLFELRGFTRSEARSYLLEKLSVRPDLITPILERCAKLGSSPVRRIGTRRPPHDLVHYNPNQLRLYRELAQELPPLTSNDFQQAFNDVGLTRRSLGHVSSLARLAIPLVALIRHVDQETLAAVLDVSKTEIATVWDELSCQEWISVRRSEWDLVSTELLEAEQFVANWMLSYYRQMDRQALRIVRQRAAAYLRRITLEFDLRRLEWSLFDATARAIDSGAGAHRLIEWWTSVESRVRNERETSLILGLTTSLLSGVCAVSPEADAEQPSTPGMRELRRRVLATYEAALLQNRTSNIDIFSDFGSRISSATADPTTARVQLRGLVGKIAATRTTMIRLDDDTAELWAALPSEDVSDALDAQLSAAFVAAAEALVEQAEWLALSDADAARKLLFPRMKDSGQDQAPVPGPVALASLVRLAAAQWHLQQVAPAPAIDVLVAFAAALAGRTLALMNDPAAVDWFKRALEHAPSSLSADARAAWSDWLPPADIAARVRLEFIRCAYPAFCSPQEMLAVLGSWHRLSSNIDSNRLYAIRLQLQLASEPVSPQLVVEQRWISNDTKELIIRDRELVPGSITCNAHRIVPPLFAMIAETLAAAGLVENALPGLRQVVSQFRQYDEDTVRQADRALVRIVRRMRLREVGEISGKSLSRSPDLADQELVWALDGLDGPKSFRPLPNLPASATTVQEQAAWLHAIWRTLYSGEDRALLRAISTQLDRNLSQEDRKSSNLEFVALARRFDLFEAQLVAHEPPVDHPLFDGARWWTAHPHCPEEALRLWLRAEALGLLHPLPATLHDSSLAAIVERLGTRRAAEIALDEAELLALRLPDQAVHPMKFAFEKFDQCNDTIGTIITGISIGMLFGRLSRANDLSAALKAVAAAYQRLVIPTTASSQATPSLPPWYIIISAARQIDPAKLLDEVPKSWQPWLARLLLCLVYDQGIETPKEKSKNLTARNPVHIYLIRATERFGFTAEWSAWHDLMLKTAGLSKSHGGGDMLPVHTPKIVMSRDLAAIRDVFTPWFLLGSVVIVILLIATFFPLRWILNLIIDVYAFPLGLQVGLWACTVAAFGCTWSWNPIPTPLSSRSKYWRVQLIRTVVAALGTLALWLLGALVTGSTIGMVHDTTRVPISGITVFLVTLYALVLIVAAGTVSEVLRRLILIRSVLVWHISPLRTPNDRTAAALDLRSVKLCETWRRPFPDFTRWPPTLHARQKNKPIVLKLPKKGPYRDFTRVMPSPSDGVLSHDFNRLVSLLGKQKLEIVVKAPEELHGVPWEAVATLAVIEKGQPQQEVPFRFRRQISNRPEAWTRGKGTVLMTWSGNQATIEIAKRGWKEVGANNIFAVTASRADNVEAISNPPESIAVLHLVGTAEDTRAGLRFNIEQDRTSELTSQPLHLSATSSRLISAADIVRIFPQLELCVLQGETGIVDEQRVEGDRLEAALARRFAAELYAQGGPTVIVIPPLEPEIAIKVLQALSAILVRDLVPTGRREILRVLRRKPRPRLPTAMLEHALVAAQNEIVRSIGVDENGWELALDMCLFAPSHSG